MASNQKTIIKTLDTAKPKYIIKKKTTPVVMA